MCLLVRRQKLCRRERKIIKAHYMLAYECGLRRLRSRRVAHRLSDYNRHIAYDQCLSMYFYHHKSSAVFLIIKNLNTNYYGQEKDYQSHYHGSYSRIDGVGNGLRTHLLQCDARSDHTVRVPTKRWHLRGYPDKDDRNLRRQETHTIEVKRIPRCEEGIGSSSLKSLRTLESLETLKTL